MAAQVLPPSSGGSFLDSPVFNHTRTKPPPSGFSRLDTSSPTAKLCFDTSDTQEVISAPYSLTSQLNTPDSGFSGAASCTPLKTPESEFSSSVATPPSGGNSHRKRKTVTIDESQTSVVVISPDDLFNTYSKPQSESQNEHEDIPASSDQDSSLFSDLLPLDQSDVDLHLDDVTGWPIKRSESLESRDNPFLPGGELSREAEDLLSRATIIRDHFYLNEEEKRALREQQHLQEQQQKQQRGVKHVQIIDNPDHHSSNTSWNSPSSPLAVNEETVPFQSLTSPLLAAVPDTSLNGNDKIQLQPRENGKAGDSVDNVKTAIPDDENHTLTGASPNFGGGDLQVHDSDKKQRNKCCSVM